MILRCCIIFKAFIFSSHINIKTCFEGIIDQHRSVFWFNFCSSLW